jgi:hypothetical protein
MPEWSPPAGCCVDIHQISLLDLNWSNSIQQQWGALPTVRTTMRHIDDRPPVRFMVLARLIRLLTWSRTNLVEFGVIATAVSTAAIRLSGEQWWAAALCGVLFGIAAVLCLRPSPAEPLDDRR